MSFRKEHVKEMSYAKNEKFIACFGEQLEKYCDWFDHGEISYIVSWYNDNKIEISPFLKDNLLDTMNELLANMWKVLDIQIMKNYEKYKYIEGTDADGWTYRLLKSCKELRLEAEDMRNDFYENGYFKEMADGSKLIVVATKPDGTKIDIEVLNYTTFTICENYYKYQREVDEDEDYYHLKRWIDGIKKLRVDKLPK